MSIYDVVIVGNGIIGSLLVKSLLKKKIKTCLVGPSNRKGSATLAAGAMINVFGELDFWEKDTIYQKQKILLGIEANKAWKKLSIEFFNNESFKSADDTIVYLSKKATNLEKNCFNLIKQISNQYLGSKLNSNQNKKIAMLKNSRVNQNAKEFFLIKGEGAMDTSKIFNYFDKQAIDDTHGHYLNDNVKSIIKKNNIFILETNLKKTIKSKKIIICNGAFLNQLNLNTLPVYYGVGSALELHDKKNDFTFLPKKTVIRTPNRGSTCGIHIVPRNKQEYYVGAGSYITKKPVYGHRVGTVNYLLNCLETEFTGKLPHTVINFVQGFRPISIDGKPLVGTLELDKDIFIASGTKRDGFTYAPILTDYIVESFIEEKKEPNYRKLFIGWEPDRQMISFLDRTQAIEAYIDNKIAGLLEHGSIKDKNQEKKILNELYSEANIFHDKIQKKFKLSSNFGIHPELLNVI